MVSVTVLFMVFGFVVIGTNSETEVQPEPFKDTRLFTVKALEDPDAQTTDQWKDVNLNSKYGRIRATPEKCKAFVQGLTNTATGELMWDEHRCTVLTLVYKCNAKVRLLSRSGRDVLAEGDDRKELFLEILVDDGRKRVIPLDGAAERELTMLLLLHNQQDRQFDHPDLHMKKKKVLGPDYFGKEQNSFGFDDCAF